MATIPQLNEDDFRQFESSLGELLGKTEASVALIVEKAGYLIHQAGTAIDFDTTTVATLASNAFNATEFMAKLINEPQFTGLYQQGLNYSTLILNIDDNCLLVVVFKASLSVGMIKYYAANSIKVLAEQLRVSQERAPDASFDLVDLNPADVGQLFRKKES